MASIGIIGTSDSFYSELDYDNDSKPLVAALEARGHRSARLDWHEDLDWSAWDLLVLRSPWDYTLEPRAFDAWLERAGTASRVLNDPALVRWNMDKRYLAALEAEGVAGVPTSYHEDEESLTRALDDLARGDGEDHVVLKPAVGAGARMTGLFSADSPAALSLGREILAEGGVVMLQPEIPELSAGAEKALYLLDGHFTHAIAKGALLARGGGLIGGVYQENPVVVETSEAERAFAERALAAVTRATGQQMPLYARIDTVDSAEHGLVLLEAELFEPTFNLHLVPEVVDRFAEAIIARLPQQG
ncbi:hypothetical protein DEO23_00985 [Brachybacterium endophyticum]|uniref:ATP-grasp domain-containing protein n=1 Tax=Brachybacterium endophyticum TaxID=2182385 RepID=A0A2U2RN16_9MICO|nr:hypothetical protein [Brachybacterium endophyticum]PWH07263.1 hypothetical protein DEO23_00985 [Brachybacterium endophyticum]